MFKRILNEQNLNKGLLILLLIGIIPYLYLANFAHPIADDFGYTISGINGNILNSIIKDYFYWNGRYASNLLVHINPMIWNNLTAYQLVPVFLILFSILGFYFLLNSLFTNNLKALTKINLSLALTLFFIYQMPSVAEGFYWYTGSISYQAANILFLIYLGLIINYFNDKLIGNKSFHLLFSSILLFIIIGFNEVIMIIALIFHLLCFVTSSKQKYRKPMLFLLIIAILASCIMILAPGNAVRGSNYHDKYNLVRSLSFTGFQMIRFFFDWISNLPFILGSVILLTFASKKLNEKSSWLNKVFDLPPFYAFLLLIAPLFLCIFPTYWTTNILGQHRTVNTAYFFFILGWIYNLFVWSAYLTKKQKLQININSFSKQVIIGLISLSLISTKNGYHSIIDIISGNAHQFDEEMTERTNKIIAIKKEGLKDVVFLPLKSKPHTLFVLDLTADPNYWINKGQGIYYGVNISINNCE